MCTYVCVRVFTGGVAQICVFFVFGPKSQFHIYASFFFMNMCVNS